MSRHLRILRAVYIWVPLFVVSFSLIAVPTVQAKKTPPIPAKVFILVPGITSELTQADVNNNFTPGFEAVKMAIVQAVPEAQFVTYSYNGPKAKKKPEPKPYTCEPTLNKTIGEDIVTLGDQVQAVLAKQPNAEIYLVGHSLGGVIAFGYLAALAEQDALLDPELQLEAPIVKRLPNNNLKGVVTLDSPLGGIPGDNPYFGAAQSFFRTICGIPGFDDLPALVDLRLFSTSPLFSVGGSHDPLGSEASLLSVSFPNDLVIPIPFPANQIAAQDAYSDMGVRTLTIGNFQDMLWEPGQCGLGEGQFSRTQWVRDQTFEIPVYARVLNSGSDNCFIDGVLGDANHLRVLTDSNVTESIKQFITNQEPTALPQLFGDS